MSDQTTNTSSRRLAAILFADMVGYTAMMQKDEQKASILLRRFQHEVEDRVSKHKGQVVNFYGDGALCIFQSPLEAVRCAMDLQASYLEEPVIPVRIGLHSGTVVMEGEKVFGDSVNLASRIESMGVPGSLLFSRKIRDDIKNQPDFEIKALGSFAFKNVEEPLEVFALANQGFVIPERADMEGKFAPSGKTKSRNHWTWVLIAGLALMVGIAAIYIYRLRMVNSFTPEDKSIAILPFKDLSPEQDQEYFSDGIAEEILLALSKVKDLKVAGRISSFSFKDEPNVTIQDIGRQLNVSTLLNGSVRKYNNKVRVTTDLVNVKDGFQIWSEKYDMELQNIFSLQESIAQKIVEKLRLTQLRDEKKPLLANQTDNLEAYDHYLKGRFNLNRSIDGTLTAMESFENAIQMDPDYVPALNGLGDAYFHAAIYDLIPGEEAWKNLERISKRAIAIDPNSAEAYARLGYYYFYGERDWDQAQSNFEKGVSLGFGKSDYYMALSLLDPKEENLERTVLGMQEEIEKDPLSIPALLGLNRALLHNRQYNEVIKNATKVFDLDPDQRSALRHIGEAYLFSGRPAEALPYFERAKKNNHYAFFNYILCLVKLGREDEARERFRETENHLSSYSKALSLLALGNLPGTFQYLEEARLQKSARLLFMRVDHHYDTIRSDSRYLELEQSMNFPSLTDN